MASGFQADALSALFQPDALAALAAPIAPADQPHDVAEALSDPTAAADQDHSHHDLLCRAARAGMSAEVRALVELDGADVNFRLDGLTPLMLACFADGHTPVANDLSQPRRLKIIETLLENRGNVNAENSTGWTPLFFATFYAQHDMVPCLLQARADVTHRDKTGRDASSWLRWSEPDREKQKPILKMLYERGLPTPIFQLVKQQRLSNAVFCPMTLDAAAQAVEAKTPVVVKKKPVNKDKKGTFKEKAPTREL